MREFYIMRVSDIYSTYIYMKQANELIGENFYHNHYESKFYNCCICAYIF